jgi:hypothetical protein
MRGGRWGAAAWSREGEEEVEVEGGRRKPSREAEASSAGGEASWSGSSSRLLKELLLSSSAREGVGTASRPSTAASTLGSC